MENQEPVAASKRSLKPVIVAGIVAVIIAILGILGIARQNKIPQPPHTHTEATTPSLIPTMPRSLDDRLKSLQDELVNIDISLNQNASPSAQ